MENTDAPINKTTSVDYITDPRTGRSTVIGGNASPEDIQLVMQMAQMQRSATYGDIQKLCKKLDRIIELLEIQIEP